MNNYKFNILGIDCPNCANKLESSLAKEKEFISVSLSFINKTLIISSEKNRDDVINIINKVIAKVEPDAYLDIKNNENKKHEHHEHHHHEHHHEHHHNHQNCECHQKNKININFILIILSIILLVIGIIFEKINNTGIISFILFIVSYLCISYDILFKSFKSILRGQVFDENFLMGIASIGAMCIQEYHEAILVIFLYKLGEMFQDYAVNNSKRSIKSLLDLKVETVNLFTDNKIETIKPKEVKVNDVIIVRPGEKVPLDGVIIEGNSSFDTSSISGESKPLDLFINDEISSGYINLSNVIKIRVSKTYENSNVSKIIKMLEESMDKKSNNEKFISKFAKYYTPIVVCIAFLIVLVPFILKVTSIDESINVLDYVSKALVFLVVSCPCALVLSIPLAFFAGIGRASKSGILIKGSNYLEKMNSIDSIVFDKTGTITKGNFKVSKVISNNEEETLRVAYLVDYYSTHPIAQAIKDKCKEINVNLDELKEVNNLAGLGSRAIINDIEALVGNKLLMEQNNIIFDEINEVGSIVYVAYDKKYLGAIIIKDELKENISNEINYINNLNINTIMLSGDNNETCKEVSLLSNIKEYRSNLLPLDKVEEINKLINNKKDNKSIVFIGDGINDAPSLVQADVGISMGNIGADLAIESSDIVISDDSISKVIELIAISKKTNLIVKENIIFSLGIKVIVMILSLFGLANILLGIFADVGVMILAVLNAMRILSIKKKA